MSSVQSMFCNVPLISASAGEIVTKLTGSLAAEASVHAARSFILEMNDTGVLLKLDFKNAFNSVHRDKMLSVIRTHLPQYYGSVWQMYWQSSQLHCEDFSLLSESGVQQGDPLGPLLFCLVTRDLNMSMKSAFNIWYLDDGTLGRSPGTVEQDLCVVLFKGQDIGLELNMSKCEAFVHGGESVSRALAIAQFKQLSPDIKSLSSKELSLLGSPLHLDAAATAI
jgi:hypothetical protein